MAKPEREVVNGQTGKAKLNREARSGGKPERASSWNSLGRRGYFSGSRSSSFDLIAAKMRSASASCSCSGIPKTSTKAFLRRSVILLILLGNSRVADRRAQCTEKDIPIDIARTP